MEDVSNLPSFGPGGNEDVGEAPRPLLEGASDYEYIEILNILPAPFHGRFAATKPVSASVLVTTSREAPGLTKTAQDVRTNYGLDLNNPDVIGRAHVNMPIEIGAGKTMRLLGSGAQVILKQLVDAAMQFDGKRLQLADPFARHEYEVRIVQGRHSVEELADIQSVNQQLQQAIKASNEEEFPDLGADQGTEPAAERTGNGDTDSPKPSPGRPRKNRDSD